MLCYSILVFRMSSIYIESYFTLSQLELLDNAYEFKLVQGLSESLSIPNKTMVCSY